MADTEWTPAVEHLRAMHLGAECARCPLRSSEHRPVFAGKPQTHHILTIVGEAPGSDEERERAPFVGTSGRLLDNTLDRYGVPRRSCHVTNACLCRGHVSPKEWNEAIACCKPRLEKELRGAPHVVLALGKQALYALTGKRGIFDWMGAPIAIGASGLALTKHPRNVLKDKKRQDFEGFSVLPTLHPAFVLRPDGRAYLPVFHTHVLRACMIAGGKIDFWRWAPKTIVEPGIEMLNELRRIASRAGRIGFDVETMGTDPMHNKVMAIGLATSDVMISMPWHGYTAKGGQSVRGIEEYEYGPKIQETLAKILANPRIVKVMQNGQHDYLTAESIGMRIEGFDFDTLHAHGIVIQGIKHDLGTIASIEFSAPRWKTEFHVTGDAKGLDAFVKRDPLELRYYNARDAYVTYRLYGVLKARLAETNNGEKIMDETMKLVHIAIKMRRRGVPLDTDVRKGSGLSKFDEHRRALVRRRGRAKRDLCKIAEAVCPRFVEAPFNPRSNAHLHQLFFSTLKVQPKTWSEKTNRPRLDEKLLSSLAAHPNRVVSAAARCLLRFRRWDKLLKTYVVGLARQMDADDIVHPSWNVTGARTRRWTSQPNLQNIPKPMTRKLRSGELKVIYRSLRDLFVGHKIPEEAA